MATQDLVRVTTYIPPKTKQKWITHLKNIRPKYTSLSHLVEDAVEYKIAADHTPINIIAGKVGPRKK